MSVELDGRSLGGIRAGARNRRLLVVATASAPTDEAAKIGA